MKILVNLMIFLPVIAALLCLVVKDRARQIALAASVITCLFSVIVAVGYYQNDFSGVAYLTEVSWITSINVWYMTGVDGLNLPLVLLTTALSILVVLASWKIQKSIHAYMALYLLLLAGMLGVFLALDLFLFYVFFEISLLPMYFLIGIWGGPRKEYAAIKFFLYTLAGSICLLIVMLGLYFHTASLGVDDGQNTWDMRVLQGQKIQKVIDVPSDLPADQPARFRTVDGAKVTEMFSRQTSSGEPGAHWLFAKWAFWLTLIAFMIKLPAVPFHTWLPDAHVEAPTPISMILAGVLLKMGGYAMMRITWPFFPEAARHFWAYAAGLGVIAIIYGSLCALAQTDWKKLVAYSSIGHMGYVMLGIAVLTREGFNGAYFQMIAHGITSAMMFFLVGVVYDRAHHREIDRFGGLWNHWPRYTGWSMVGFFAGMGLPPLCGFIGEIMVLLGTFKAVGNEGFDPTTVYIFGVLAATGVILAAGYILWMFQRIYMGEPKPDYQHYEKVNTREYFIMVTLGLAALLLGILPFLVFRMTSPTFDSIMKMLGVVG